MVEWLAVASSEITPTFIQKDMLHKFQHEENHDGVSYIVVHN